MDTASKRKKIGEILVGESLITPAQLRAALEEQKKVGGKLGAVLISIGAIAEDDLARILGIKLRVKWVTPSQILISDEALATLDVETAKQHLVMPVHTDKRFVAVAMTDPTDLNMVDTLEFIVGKRIRPVISTATEIKRAIARYYEGKNPDKIVAAKPKSTPIMESSELLINFGDEKLELPIALESLIEMLVDKGVITKEEFSMHLYRKDQGH